MEVNGHGFFAVADRIQGSASKQLPQPLQFFEEFDVSLILRAISGLLGGEQVCS